MSNSEKQLYNNFLTKIKKIILVFSISLLIYSCKDELTSVTDNYRFDPPRFNWRAMDIYYHGFAGVWAADTSKIFLLNHNNRSLYIISGGNVSMQYVGDYYLNEIKGLSNNEVYLFGAGLYDRKLTIIKWNGAGFEYYPSNIYVAGSTYWIRGFALNSNEVWICSQSGISKFNGIKIKNYTYEDSLLTPIDLFLNNYNKLQYITMRIVDTVNTRISLFELQDNSFVRVYDYTINPYPDRTGVFLEEVGGYNIGMEYNEPIGAPWSVCVKYFTGTSFVNYFCFNNKIGSNYSFQFHNPVGVNPQSFIFLAQASDYIFEPPPGSTYPRRVGIVHWDGNRVSKELGVNVLDAQPFYYTTHILFCIDKDNYIILEPLSNNYDNSTLYILTKK